MSRLGGFFIVMDDKMAQGRMLRKEIANSEKIGNLRSDKARVLYFMMLPHLDIKGRLIAHPRIIKGQITTMLGYSEKTIQTCLKQLYEVNLIDLYNNNDKQYLQYTRFDNFQTLNPSREAESTIPGPTPENSRELQRTPYKVKLSKDKLSKDKFKPPTLKEIIEYVKEKGYQVDVKKFFEYYTESNWHDRDGRPVRNWKQKIIAVWNKPGGQQKCRRPNCNNIGVYTSTDDTGQICWWCEKHKQGWKPALPKELTENTLKIAPKKDMRSLSHKQNDQKNKLGVR